MDDTGHIWVGRSGDQKKGLIDKALHDKNAQGLKTQARTDTFDMPLTPVEAQQDAIQPHGSIHRDSAEQQAEEQTEEQGLEMWGFSLAGDEMLEGPLFNYSRVFTSESFTSHLSTAFERTTRNFQAGRAPRGCWDCGRKPEENLAGTAREIARFCGLDRKCELETYTPWTEIHPTTWRHICIAAILAVFVQWGTTGPAILIGYLTQAAGLGCRSGSYLIYGCLATVSWVLLTTASSLSHDLMLRRQEMLHKRLRSKPELGWRLASLFIATRLSGKMLAAANALWLIVSIAFELSGVYDTCWCQTNYVSAKESGWVLLFKGPEVLRPYASRSWAGGIAFLIVVCLGGCGFVWLGCKEEDK